MRYGTPWSLVVFRRATVVSTTFVSEREGTAVTRRRSLPALTCKNKTKARSCQVKRGDFQPRQIICHVTLRDLYHAISSCVMSRHVTSRQVTSCDVMLCHMTSRHVMQCHVMSYNVTSRLVKTSHVKSIQTSC